MSNDHFLIITIESSGEVGYTDTWRCDFGRAMRRADAYLAADQAAERVLVFRIAPDRWIEAGEVPAYITAKPF